MQPVIKEKNEFLDYDPNNSEHINYPYEYFDNDWPGFGISNKNYNLNKGYVIGIRFFYKKYFIEINYTKDTEKYGFVGIITVIKKRTHLLNLVLGLRLK